MKPAGNRGRTNQLEGFDSDEVIPRVRTGRVGLVVKQINTEALPNLRPPDRVVYALAQCWDLLAALMPVNGRDVKVEAVAHRAE